MIHSLTIWMLGHNSAEMDALFWRRLGVVFGVIIAAGALTRLTRYWCPVLSVLIPPATFVALLVFAFLITGEWMAL